MELWLRFLNPPFKHRYNYALCGKGKGRHVGSERGAKAPKADNRKVYKNVIGQ